MLKLEENESYPDVTVLPPGAEITRGSLSQVLAVLTTECSTTTTTNTTASDIPVRTKEEDCSETENTLAGENISEDLPSSEVQDVRDVVEQQPPGPAGLSISSQGEGERLNGESEELMKNNNALWDVYFKI